MTRAQTAGGNDITLVRNTYDELAGFSSGGSNGHLVQQESFKVDGIEGTSVSALKFHYGDPNSSAPCTVGARGYAGLNGRMDYQLTSIEPWGATLQTDFCEDELGMPYMTAYPDVSGSGRTRTKVGQTYQNGYLWEMHDLGKNFQYLKTVVYGPGGIPTKLVRGDDVQDIIDLDIRNRPSRYRVVQESGASRPDLGSVTGCGGSNASHSSYLSLGSCSGPESGGGTGGATMVTLWDSGVYGYDMAGNVKAIGSESYYYDDLSRLIHATIPKAGDTYDLAFGYDAFGNMLSQSRTASSNINSPLTRDYSVDWQTNRLTQQTGSAVPGGLNYTFDTNGDMTSEGTRGYVFDGSGRLRQVTDPDRGAIGEYDYDASGYRVRAVADEAETYYFRDASGQVLSEFQRRTDSDSPTPGWNKDYVYALGKSFTLLKNAVPEAVATPWATNVTSTHIDLHWNASAEPDILGYVITRLFKADSGHAEVPQVSVSIPVGTTVAQNLGFPSQAGDQTTVKYAVYVIGYGGESQPRFW